MDYCDDFESFAGSSVGDIVGGWLEWQINSKARVSKQQSIFVRNFCKGKKS